MKDIFAKWWRDNVCMTGEGYYSRLDNLDGLR